MLSQTRTIIALSWQDAQQGDFKNLFSFTFRRLHFFLANFKRILMTELIMKSPLSLEIMLSYAAIFTSVNYSAEK